MATQFRQTRLVPSQTVIGTSQSILVAFNPNRRSCIINNLGPGILYITTREGAPPAEGFPMAVNQALEFSTPTQFYASASVAGTVVGIMEEV